MDLDHQGKTGHDKVKREWTSREVTQSLSGAPLSLWGLRGNANGLAVDSAYLVLGKSVAGTEYGSTVEAVVDRRSCILGPAVE